MALIKDKIVFNKNVKYPLGSDTDEGLFLNYLVQGLPYIFLDGSSGGLLKDHFGIYDLDDLLDELSKDNWLSKIFFKGDESNQHDFVTKYVKPIKELKAYLDNELDYENSDDVDVINSIHLKYPGNKYRKHYEFMKLVMNLPAVLFRMLDSYYEQNKMPF